MQPSEFDDVVKKWWQSFTVWFNGMLLAVVAPLVAFLPELMVQLPILKEYVPDNMYKWLFLFTVFGNTLIRVFKTKTAVTL
jgi:hypothetical protein